MRAPSTIGARLPLRLRLFLLSALLLSVLAAVIGTIAAGRARASLVAGVDERLLAHGRLIAELVEPDDPDLDEVVRAIAAASDERITLIAADGTVVADSEVDEVASMDNHGSRPEVRDALASGAGVGHRFSDTLGRRMAYAAVPWTRRGVVGGVVRVARPHDEIDAEVRQLWSSIALVGVLGLAGCLVVVALSSNLATADLRRLVIRARALVRAEGTVAPQGDEVALLSASFEQLSAELRAGFDLVTEQRNRLQALLAGMGEAMLAVDAQGLVHTTNPAATRMFALDGDATGLPLEELVRDPALAGRLRALLQGGPALDADVPLPAGGRTLSVTATPQHGGGAVLILRDVSELRRLEAVRRDFVANVSHELRTPVAVIRSNAEALLDGALGDPEHGPAFVGAIHRHAERLGTLITDLLDLARIEAGARELAAREVPVGPVVRSVLDTLGSAIAERGHEVTVALPPGLAAWGDPAALEHALSNLVDNAVKYTPRSGRIHVGAWRDGDRVIVEVADDGPGIAAENRQRIFERFFRVDPGRSRGMGGTGLGLSIVKHLVEVMDGQVWVEPNEPRGSRFRMRLPAADP